MFFKSLIILLSFNSFSNEIDTQTIFTNLKELSLYKELKDNSEFKKCLNKHSLLDLKKIESDEQLDKVSQCFINKIPDDELEILSKKLGSKTLKQDKGMLGNNLREYFIKKISAGLLGEAISTEGNLKNFKIVSQERFIEIHQNRVTNSLINEISRYCIKSLYSKESEQNQVLEAINSLGSKDIKSIEKSFLGCLGDIKNSKCIEEKLNFNSESKKTNLCSLKFKLREYRKVIKKIKTNKDALKSALKESKLQLDQSDLGISEYTGESSGEASSAELVNLSSNDIYQALNNPKDISKISEEYFNQFCNHKNLDIKKCSKILNVNEIEVYNQLKFSILSDFNSKIQKSKKLKTKDGLLNDLKEEGLISNKKLESFKNLSIKEVRSIIEKIYSNHKISTIKELNEKYEKKLVSKDLNQKQVLKMKEELEQREDTILKLTSFTNILSQFYTVKDGNSDDKFNYYLPSQLEAKEFEEVKTFIKDPDAYKWIYNLSNESKSGNGNSSLIIDDKLFEDLLD